MYVNVFMCCSEWDYEPNNWGGNGNCVEMEEFGFINDNNCAENKGFIYQKFL
jgi:hypothetical protein